MAQPPGKEILAFLYIDKSGPNTSSPALIVFINLYGAKVLIFVLGFLIIIFFFFKTFNLIPMNFNKSTIVKISFTRGTLFSVTCFDKIDAARIGKVAFLILIWRFFLKALFLPFD